MSDTPPNAEAAVCEMRRLDDGSVVIVCARQAKRGRLPKCRRCGAPAGLLCDGPADPLLGSWPDPANPTQRKEYRTLCSMPLCQGCAYAAPDGMKHYCWHHRRLTEAPVDEPKKRKRDKA